MFRNFGIGVGDKPSGISMEAVANPPKPVERMYTPVNYRYRIAEDAEAEAGIPGPMARPELRRESDRRRRGSRDEGVMAAKVKSSFHPKPGPGRSLQSGSRPLEGPGPRPGPPPTPLMNSSLQAVRKQAQPTPFAQQVSVNPVGRPSGLRPPMLTGVLEFQAAPAETSQVYAPPPRVAMVTSMPAHRPAYWMPGSMRVSPCMSPAVPSPIPTWAGYQSPAPFVALSASAPQVLVPPPQPTAERQVERTVTPEASAPAANIASWAEVISGLRSEAGDGYFVCIIGGAETPGAGTMSLLSSLAQELHSRLPRSVVFVVGTSQGVAEAFCTSTDAEPDRVWNITEGWLHAHGLAAGDERELLAHIGDVYIFVEGGEDEAWIARKAAERGADLVPIKRSGGASTGLHNFPEEALQRPPFVGEACWALLADSTAPIAAASAAASAAVAGALAKRCREKQPAEGSPSRLQRTSDSEPPGSQVALSLFDTTTPSWAAASWVGDRAGGTVPANAEKSEKKIFQTSSAPLSFTPAVWTSPGTSPSPGSLRVPAAPFAARWPGSFSPLPWGPGVAKMPVPVTSGSFTWSEPPRRVIATTQWNAQAVEPRRPEGLFRSSSEIIIGNLGDSEERAHCQKPRASSPLTTRSHAKYFAADQ